MSLITIKSFSQPLPGLALTLLVAISSGYVLDLIGLPVPYLLGSLFGVWGFGGFCAPARELLQIPTWLRVSVILMLGVLIGAMFGPQVLEQIPKWLGSISILLLTTAIATALGYSYLVKVRGYQSKLALLCALPGGQAELIAISRDLVDKDYVVALCHLIRVTFVFCSIPLLLAVSQGQEAVIQSQVVMESLPGLSSMPATELLGLVVVALIGYAAAILTKMPMPHLLGPMLLSIALHLGGLIQIPRPQELVLLAQIVIGAGVGSRLAKVEFSELKGYLIDALINSIILFGSYALMAMLTALILNTPGLTTLLAFSPGGVYEVTLLAMLFGFDIAYISMHHAIRVLAIIFTLPMLIRSGKQRAE